MSDPLVIGSIPKSGGEVRIQIDSFNGHDFLTIRFFMESKDGSLLPTKKGVTIPLDQVDTLKEIVNSIPDTTDTDKPEEEEVTDETQSDLAGDRE